MLIEESMAVEMWGEGKEATHPGRKLRRLYSLHLSPKNASKNYEVG